MLTWIRRSTGGACWYETACKRFSLSRGLRGKARGTWTLFDREAKDPVVPQHNRMENVYSLATGKLKAQRWAEGKTH